MITEKVINYYRFTLLHFLLIAFFQVLYFISMLVLRIGPLAQAGSAAGF